jgi:ribosomal-protein-alanine N-acetyltransferase
MIAPGTLTTTHLHLQTRGVAAAAEVLDYHTRIWPAIAEWMPLVDAAYFTLAAQTARLQTEHDLREQDRALRLYLVRRGDAEQRIIGDVHLFHIVRGAFQSCFLGYKMDPAHMGRGYMTEAVERVVAYAFDTLRLHRIEANVMPRNHASRRVVEKCGFRVEGLSPKYLKINGVWEDHLHYVVLNPAEE